MTHPDYIIHLSVYIDEKFGEPVFHLNIRHWSEGQYTVILDCNVTSFNEELKTVGSAQIHEILDDVAVKVDIDGSPLIIQTQSSHGYMVSLPEIGNIVVSNDGNLAIEGNHNIESLKIAVIAPYQVILFRAVVNQMDISSQGVILFKESIVEMDSLQIVPVDNNKGSITCFLMTEGSEFKAHELLLNNSIVYSLGTMNVENVYCRGSSILNFGSFTTKLLDNVTYLFNGKESSIKEVQKIVSSYVINHGLINFQNLEIFTSADIKNFGVLDGKSNLYMNCLCNNINEGMFRSKNQIVFDGNQLELSKGSSIVTNTFQFLCKSTTISTNIEGVNVKMLNLVQANSFNIFKNVEIYGVFINYGALYVDNNISLLGKKASIMNAGNIEVSNEILSLALEDEICDYIGERYEKVNKYIKNPNHPDEWRIHINCKGIRVKSSLNINATFHTVHNIEVYESSKLYIFKTSIIQGLKSIVNRGEASMFSSSPTLESFINEPQAKLILESKTYYGEIHGELELEGEVHIGDYFPNINSMTIKEGAKVYLNKGNEFPSLSTLTNHGEALVSPSRIFNSLKSVINYGNIFVKVIHKEIDESVISIGCPKVRLAQRSI
ncbi:hypothetical protein TVAG_049860 [Trichomonas vaginalis G3]|uniref:Uncharacterized protein n=1 Tax=Trichomonas vaginalis (strain ATCC PRA-98 / G3) TaxID=412133 RepID=A2EVY1_TRIV3|nr:hypothetical protein TVAG_049860 [Trichomonas vaginalis G3]|eukprot:XP_001315425.1 hypothetical protein [Trichomonas vaginalis G3]